MQRLELPFTGVVDGGAVGLAHAVDHEHEAFIPIRREVGRSGVREMVVDVPDPLEGQRREEVRNPRGERLPREHITVKLARDGIEREDRAVGPVIEGVDDLVNVVQFDACQFQARGKRSGRERAGVLTTADPLLGDGRHELPIHDQRGGRIVSLGYPVLARLELRPVSSLEIGRPVDPADANYVHRSLPVMETLV